MLTPAALAKIEADYTEGRYDHRTIRELLAEVKRLQSHNDDLKTYATKALLAFADSNAEAERLCIRVEELQQTETELERLRQLESVIRSGVEACEAINSGGLDLIEEAEARDRIRAANVEMVRLLDV